MASGSELPIRIGGLWGHQTTTTTTAFNLPRNAGTTSNWGRIQCFFTSSTTATISTSVPGWVRWYGASIGTMRCEIWHNVQNDVNQAEGTSGQHPFTMAVSAWECSVGASWDNIDANTPLVGTPVTVSGTTGTSLVVPSFTCPDGAFPMWVVAAKYSASGTAQAWTLPSDLFSEGTVTPSTATGMGCRAGGWMTGSGEPNRGLRAPGNTGTKTFTRSGGTPTALAGVCFAIKPADRGHLMALA
jgi:hypothetical protein